MPKRPARYLAAVSPALLAGLWGLWAALPAHPGPPAETGFFTSWAEGPVRWLMLPEEERQAARVRTRLEAIAFVDAFWKRRDPDGERHPGNPFELAFQDRVLAADGLYSEDTLRGSLTDRGRALVLLGPPPRLAYGPRSVPSFQPGRQGERPAVATRQLTVETWTYPEEELPPRLCELLREGDRAVVVTLSFVVDPRHSYQIEGERVLVLAARAAVVADPPAVPR